MSLAPQLRTMRSLPRLALLGFVVMTLGLAVDVVVHVLFPGQLHDAFSGQEHLAHFIVLVGMVLALGGIVASGLRRRACS